MLFGLIAATGLRVSEALDLRLDDVLADGVLHIRDTKFGKSRLVQLHSTVVDALDRYLDRRRLVAGSDDHLFPSAKGKRLASSTVNYTFRCVLRLRILLRSGPGGRAFMTFAIASRRMFWSNATPSATRSPGTSSRWRPIWPCRYQHTYWYLQATPELMTDIAAAAETFDHGGAHMTLLAPLITGFLRDYMPRQRGYSSHSCEAYAYTSGLVCLRG